MKREIRKLLPRALGLRLCAGSPWGASSPLGWPRPQLPQNVLRLHVVANSDSPADQAVKLKVRDAVLEEAARWYGDAATMEEANFALCTHLESITQAANEALLENGSPHTAPGPGHRPVLSHPGLRGLLPPPPGPTAPCR